MGRRVAAAAFAALLAALSGASVGALSGSPGASPRLAADAVTFAAPSATGSLGAPVVYREAFRAATAPQRVELLTTVPGIEATLVTPAQVTGSSGSFSATVSDPEHFLPNTTVEYRFRVTAPDGMASVGPAGSITIVDRRYSWQVMTGRHVRLHWYQGGAAFARQALQIGDNAVTKVSGLLGVTETAPIDFFIYASQAGLDGALGPGTSEFVAGRAAPEIRTLFAEIDPSQIGSSWVSTVIPHELTHLVFDTATHNPIHEPPLWLNEGLAVYESQGYDSGDRQLVAGAVASGTVIPLDGLEGPFPQRQALFYLSYAEAVSAVDFLVRAYGQPKLVKLIRSYATGLTDDEAFRAATGGDVAAFDAAWLRAIGAAPPRSYGPQPAPAGAVPPGWSGSGATMTSPGSSAPASVSPGATAGPGAPAPGPGGSGGLLPEIVAAAVGLLLLAGLVLVLRDRERAARRPRRPDGGGQ